MCLSLTYKFGHRILGGTLLGLASMLASAPSFSQAFPERPISIVVPYAAGGSSDVVARLLAAKLAEQFGQAVVVENKPGAGSTIGTAHAARRGQGGHLALLADNGQTVAPAMYQKLPYDAINDFWPVGFVGQARAMLFASTASGLRNVQELRERAIKNPKTLTIGTGNGSPSHLISELFQIRANAKLQIVPYKGAAASLNDLLAGHIDLVFTNPASASQYIGTGRINLLGQSGDQRDPKFPDVPTFKEMGVNDMNAMYWFALILPSDTPADIKARWRKELDIALASPEISAKLTGLGINKVDMTPDQTQEFIRQEAATWKSVAQSAGLKAN